jgi:hypothetical protein
VRILPAVRDSGAGAVFFSIVFACFAVEGCGSSGAAPPSTPTAQQQGVSRPETISSEGCSESGRRVDLVDVNGDQKADIHRVFDKGTGKEVCRVSDLNHDGKPDLIEYFDDSGNVRRREYCYDNDGLVNAIEYYEGGKLVRREYDTTHRHKIDTWDWFDANAAIDDKTKRPKHPTHRERDTSGNGKISEWWTWDGDKVTIAVDSNGDGKPDPASALTLNSDGTPVAAGAPEAGAPAPASAGDAGASAATVAADASAAVSTASTDGGSR